MRNAIRQSVALALLVLVLCSWIGPFDSIAKVQIDTGLKRAMVSYATARALNAAISVVQGTEVAFEPGGVGMNFTPGRALEPINDLVEQFSVLMLVACVVFGMQKLLISIGGFAAVSLLLTAAAVGWGWLHFNHQKPPIWLTKLLVILLMVRFAIPLVTLGTDQLFDRYMSNSYNASEKAIEAAPGQVTEVNPSEPVPAAADQGLIDRMKEKAQAVWAQTKAISDVKMHYTQLKQNAEEWAQHIITLIAIFMLQTVIIPALLIWGLYAIVKGSFDVSVMTPRPAALV